MNFQDILIENLLLARHCSKQWEDSADKTDTNLYFCGAGGCAQNMQTREDFVRVRRKGSLLNLERWG